MKRRSLLTKMQAAFAAALIGVGIMTIGIVWFLSRQAIRSQVKQDVQLASTYLQRYMTERRANLNLQTRLIVEQPALRAIAADPEALKDTATLADRLEFFRKAVGTDGLICRNLQGTVVCQIGTTPPGKSQSQGFNLAPQSSGEPVDTGVSTCSKGFLLSALAPIKVGAQTVAWVQTYSLVGSKVAEQIAGSLGIEVAFLFEENTVAASRSDLSQTPTDDQFHLIDSHGVRLGSQTFSLSESDGQPGISVTVMRPEAQATQAYRKFTTALFAFLPFALFVTHLMASHLAKGITRPLKSVVLAAEDLRQGLWPQKLEVTSNDEIGLLQSVFNETVDSLKASQDRLLAMIDSDPLTGLMNHRKFKETLAAEVARSEATQDDLSLLMIDIDKFKVVNETGGLAAGDILLEKLAQTLMAKSPEISVCSRFGGEEFAILLPNLSLKESEVIAEQLRIEVESADLGVTVSIGCAQFGVNTRKAEGLTIAAELAVARAKQLGRNMVCTFDSVPGADANADPYQLHKYLQDASLATIQALAAAVDAKDSYTEGHSRRVAEYAVQLGRHIGLSEAEIDLIHRTATLHDVGKIGVPDTILKKPGHLNPDERAIMETHPVLGELIVRKAPQLEDTLLGVRNHHEAWDGTGYPDKLSGEDIPFVARLLALADTFDAMTSDRPYRKGLSVDTALDEIKNKSGIQFDPRLATAFVDMMRKHQELAA